MRRVFIQNLFLLFCSLVGFPVLSQEDYSVAKIEPGLLSGANVVIRLDESYFEIISKGEAKQHNHLVVTILNEKGEEGHGQLIVRYDKFTKITDISGSLFDAAGKLLKKLKNADIEDYGYGSAGDDITDARIKVAGFGKKSYAYPYTIEYSYNIRDRNLMFYPGWMPAQDSETAVEHSVFKIKAPAGFPLRFKEYNDAPKVAKTKDADGADLYIWKLDNRPAATKTDAYPLHPIESTALVLAAPSEFTIQDYQGNFTSWEDLSKFYYTLNAGRDVLPLAMQVQVQELVKNAKSDREKILIIYKWMQGRSRYVSIQLGIGGWQTIDAATVAAKGYGDCKALTNFTLAALRQAGIPCYAALVKAGEEMKIKADFPSSQFNHVIACAIAGKDTMWLECTSQTTPANFMGTFTGGRPALLVMPKGGKLVTTPEYQSHHNLRNSRSQVKLEESGDGRIRVETLYRGLQQESRKSILHNSSGEAQRKWILSHVNLPSLDLESFELVEGKDEEPSVTERLSLNVRNCATKMGTRLFVKTSLLSRPFDLPMVTERTTDFYLPPSEFDFTDIDSIAYTIPEGYKPESMLPASKIFSIFGSFETRTSYTANQLLCYRKVILKGGRFAAKDYPAWIEFLKKVRKADRAQVVFAANKE